MPCLWDIAHKIYLSTFLDGKHKGVCKRNDVADKKKTREKKRKVGYPRCTSQCEKHHGVYFLWLLVENVLLNLYLFNDQ